MKFKITIFIIFTLLLVGICVGENIVIHRTFNEFDERLERISPFPDTFNYEEILDTEKWLKQKCELLEITMSVQLLDDMMYTYGELIGAVEANDTQSARGYVERLKEYSELLCDMYEVRFHNIL